MAAYGSHCRSNPIYVVGAIEKNSEKNRKQKLQIILKLQYLLNACINKCRQPATRTCGETCSHFNRFKIDNLIFWQQFNDVYCIIFYITHIQYGTTERI